jgi:predicted alpha/beta-fold hydrolase
MPLVCSSYGGSGFWGGAHLQTILPSLLPRRLRPWRTTERLELDDGDFIDLRWTPRQHSRLAILSHGLEGSVEAGYMRGMADTLHGAGWDVLGWNYRGCGGVENRRMRSYHSGETGDLRAVIDHAAGSYDRLALVGFSLGGNISLKCAAEAAAHPALAAVAAVSAPVDLASSARRLDEVPSNRLYRRRFLNTLIAKTMEKARRFPELGARLAGRDGVGAVTTIREFDERITAPVHGFAGAEDYWSRSSALPLLPRLAVPALLLSARNDPLLDEPSFPEALARSHPFLHLETPWHGGHVGFLEWHRGRQPWSERRVREFLEGAAGNAGRCPPPISPHVR